MKTKTTFQPEDFKGSGQMVIRNLVPRFKKGVHKDDYGITVAYKVGYDPEREPCRMLLISLADGMAISFKSKEALCKHLNEDDIGFRPMEKDEIETLLGNQGNRF